MKNRLQIIFLADWHVTLSIGIQQHIFIMLYHALQ